MSTSNPDSLLNKIIPSSLSSAHPHASISSPSSFFSAEQDLYASHFSHGSDSGLSWSSTFGLGHDALHRLKNSAKKAASTQGVGAEQDRYGAKFGIDESKIQGAKDAVFGNRPGAGLGGDANAWLGADGNARRRRVMEVLGTKGIGAEQDRYAARFEGVGEEVVRGVRERLGK